MDNYTKNKLFKKIALILVVIMMFNFIVPNICNASDEDEGGSLFAPISKLVRTVADLVLQFMQGIFVGDKSLETTEISDNALTLVKDSTSFNDLVSKLKANNYYADGASDAKVRKQVQRWMKKVVKVSMGVNKWQQQSTDSKFKREKVEGYDGEYTWNEIMNQLSNDEISKLYNRSFGSGKNYLTGTSGYAIRYSPALIFSGEVPAFDVNFINPEHSDSSDSSAVILRSTVSKWYQTLQKVAIIGLLSVLVYIAIRIIIGSASSKSKYKQMLMDWLVGICILFILHYVMVFTLNITTSITKLFSSNILTENSSGVYIDNLMSTLRETLGNEDTYMAFYGELIMYVALVIFTLNFTIQYLRRVIYMAFLTIIAPLIALTYPLDKIGDGQAQAFTMWMREYIFNALIQPLHLLLYTILIFSATDLVEAYPIYGVVAIFFLVPAEKFFREMFGFNKAESVNTLGAVAGGATLMNMLNKVKAGPKIGQKHGDDKEEGSSKTRTADTNPLGALQRGNNTENTNGRSNSNNGSAATAAATASATATANSSARRNIFGRNRNLQQEDTEKAEKKEAKLRKLKLGGRYVGKAVKFTSKTALKTMNSIALGTVGLAAMGTTGDLSKAFAGLVGGAAAGRALGGRISEGITNAPNTAKRIINSAKDIRNEGARGETYAKNEKFDREFFESKQGKSLVNAYSKESVKQCLMAGVTDPKQMQKILQNSTTKEDIQKAIGYNHLAHDCPKSILYSEDTSKLRNYLASKGINVNDSDAEGVRSKMYDMLK